jgi:hypothetical protein
MNLATTIQKEFAARDAALIVPASRTSKTLSNVGVPKVPICYAVMVIMTTLAIEIAKPATIKIMPRINPYFAIFLFCSFKTKYVINPQVILMNIGIR